MGFVPALFYESQKCESCGHWYVARESDERRICKTCEQKAIDAKSGSRGGKLGPGSAGSAGAS